MAAKVEIIYEAEATSLKATVNEVNKANDAVVASAQTSSKEVANAYKSAGKSIAAAFSGNEVKKALADQNTAFDNLNKKGKTLTGQLRSLKNELSQLEVAGKGGTAQFRQLTLEAARLEDQVGDTRARVSNLASDTFKFDAAVEATQGLAAGFEVAQGAAALFGDESEDLQKALLKVQAATAIANGVQQIANLLLEESRIKTLLTTQAQAAYAVVVGTSTGAMKAFRIALAATGVGLLVLGLVALVQNFDKVKKAFSDFQNSKPENGFAQIGKAIINSVLTPFKLLIEGIEKVQSLIGDEKQVQKNKGLIDQIIANENRRLVSRENAINREIALAEALNKDTTKLEIEKEKLFLDSAKRKLDLINKNETLIRSVLRDTFDIEQERFILQQEILDRENAINVLRIENRRKTVAEIEKIESKRFTGTIKLSEEEQKKLAELNKIRVQSAATQIAILQNVNDTAIINGQNTLDKRLEQIRLEGEARKLQAIDSIQDQQEEATAIEKINAETQAAIRAERKKTTEQTIDDALEIANQTLNALSNILNLQKQLSENRIAEIALVRDKEIEAINQTTDLENSKIRQREAAQFRAQQRIAAERTKQAKAEKALSLFQAIIATATAIAKASPNPLLIAFAAATGAAQIALIAATPIPKFKKGGVVGGRSHEAGGTMIEAEKGEFVVNKSSVARHRDALDAMNRSSAAFKKYVDERYVRPALMDFAAKNRGANVTVNASLNSKSMEREIKGLRKDLKGKSTVVNINSSDSRYLWQ
jgi:hypothetical protein